MSKINTLQWSLLKILFYSDKDSLLMLGTSASDMDNPLVPHLLLPWPRTAGTMPTPWQNKRIACDTLSGHSSRTLPTFFHLRKLTFTRNVHKMKESFMKCQIALEVWMEKGLTAIFSSWWTNPYHLLWLIILDWVWQPDSHTLSFLQPISKYHY